MYYFTVDWRNFKRFELTSVNCTFQHTTAFKPTQTHRLIYTSGHLIPTALFTYQSSCRIRAPIRCLLAESFIYPQTLDPEILFRIKFNYFYDFYIIFYNKLLTVRVE